MDLGQKGLGRHKACHLAHELRDDPVEGGTLVAETLLSRAELSEVFGGLGHDVRAKLHHHSPCRGSPDVDVEEYLRNEDAKLYNSNT